MITEVRIENFLRINDQIRLQLSPMTVLVGENGAGKSSVLKALHWAIRCATLADPAKKVTLEQMDYVPSKEFLDLGHKLKLQNTSGGRKTTVTLIDEDFLSTAITVSAARNDAGVKVEINGPLTAELTNDSSPSTAFIPGLSGLAEEETILATPVLHRRASSGEGGSALRQVLLQLSAGSEGTGTEYVELEDLSLWVGKILPGVRFWIKFDRLRDRNIDVRFMTPDMKVTGQSDRVAWKSIEMAGTGFLQVVQIFAYLLYFKPMMLLIDEPDAHLHPTRQQALSKALAEATREFPDTQIIVSTHSPSLVRTLPSDTRVHWILDGKVKAQGDIVREKMGWSALDKELIIFSEDGNSKYLESILAARPNLQNRCLIWPTFGKDSLPDGAKAKSIAQRMAVRVLVHRDRDFMSDHDVEAWAAKKSYDTCNVAYWVPSGSDIESQFATVSQISRALEVSDEIAQEVFDQALGSFSEETIITEFSAAYQAAVSKLPNVEGRNPIARWAALGGFSARTVKGKEFLKAVQKACVDVLPAHGLGTKIGNRNKIAQSSPEAPVAEDLLQVLEGLLEGQ
ncbi:hemin importer ATP-binding subunit [Phaeobacter italicus]|uniref:Hemin importer ATP-binding subunit n=1 Tax=Phaeobacter italicus TaxID=481446 RepID=A0A0H5D240_9RHOB|nr:ATP-binding protein [Phaeobacter italicus]CRL10798.1 hemin importer ATP-binding subunit [Phaeobacter italicus]